MSALIKFTRAFSETDLHKSMVVVGCFGIWCGFMKGIGPVGDPVKSIVTYGCFGYLYPISVPCIVVHELLSKSNDCPWLHPQKKDKL